MNEKENKGLALLPLQDVVVGLILPLLTHQDWCALRAVDTSHLQIVTEFFAANRRLELPYCKHLTEQGLSLLTSGSSSLRSLTLSGKLLIGVETDAIYCSRLNKSDYDVPAHYALTLPGCKLLTDDILRPIIESNPLLTSLDLSDCHHLTASILQTVSVRCQRLTRLILSDCHWVSRIALTYHCSQQVVVIHNLFRIS